MTRGTDLDVSDDEEDERRLVRILIWPRKSMFHKSEIETPKFYAALLEFAGQIPVYSRIFNFFLINDTNTNLNSFFLFRCRKLRKHIGRGNYIRFSRILIRYREMDTNYIRYQKI